MMPKTLSVIIPAFNEGQTIQQNLKKVKTILDQLCSLHHLNYEIVLVDDGSDDNTYTEAEKVKTLVHNIKVIRYTQNGGKGKALKRGFNACSGDYVAFLDADMDISPEHISRFYMHMKKTGADVVIGSKRHPQSTLRYPLSRKILSEIYQQINLFLFRLNLTDTQTGFKLFKYEVLKQIFPNVLCKKYAFDLELLVNAHHRKWIIVEHPIDIDWKRSENRVGLKDIWQISLDTAAIFYRLRILKHYGGPIRIVSPKIHKVYDVLYDGIGR